MNASTSTARRNSLCSSLCCVYSFDVGNFLVSFLLRGIGESILPIDNIVNATNSTINSSILFVYIDRFKLLSSHFYSRDVEIRWTSQNYCRRFAEIFAGIGEQSNHWKSSHFRRHCWNLVDNVSDDAVEVYHRLVREIFANRVVHWGRVTIFLAFNSL